MCINFCRYSEQQDSVPVHIDVSAFGRQRANYINARNRPVQKLDRNGRVLRTFEGINAAANALGVTNGAMSRACRDNANCKGYRWRYAPAQPSDTP